MKSSMENEVAMTDEDLDILERQHSSHGQSCGCHYLVPQLISAVRAASTPAQGWQSIDSAPVNESVLVYIPNAEHYGDGIYRALQTVSDWLPDKPRHWMTTGMSIGRDCGSRIPTHWMPLPPAPEEQTK